MKILFVTGGEECACNGTGRVKVLREVTSAEPGEENQVIGWVEAVEPCHCVEAHDATVERRGTLFVCGDPNVPIRDGSIVPEDD